ncbi:MAG: hypothetical protein ACTSWY_06180 [Promethearchaeota archaeon]
MNTSVAISSKLRKRLKILAAKYDTSQAEIIRKALDKFEQEEVIKRNSIPPNIQKILDNATDQVLKENKHRKHVFEKLKQPGPDFDELRVELNV